jgi:hypothetical protein
MKFLDQEEPNNRRELSFKNGEWYHPRGVMIIIIFESPVNYSEAPLRFPEGEEFSLSHLVHRTLSGGAPDSAVRQTRVAFGCPLLF